MRAITQAHWVHLSYRVQEPFRSPGRPGPTRFQPGCLPSGLHRRLPCMALLPLAAITFSLVSLASAVFAQTFKPLFSKQYTRSVAAPVTASDEFTTCDLGGSFRLVVLNGPGGHWRISSGSIFVNGVEVVKEQDFNQQVERIERPLSSIAHRNSVEVRLRSRPGAAIEVTVEGVQSCGIRITAPTPGSLLTDTVVLVRGTVPVPPGDEVGVTVNGVLALVDAGQFAALVPVDPDVTTLTAIAADATGTVSSDTITVVVRPSTSEPLLLFQAAPAMGVAPLTIGFTLSSRVSITQITLDLEGDGIVDFQGPILEGQVFAYGTPGLYFPTVSVTDATGATHSATAPVRVDDLVAFDALLKAKWQGMKVALRQGDIDQALNFITLGKHASYRRMLTALGAQLANIDQILTDISLLERRGVRAEYQMLRVDNGIRISHFVLFVLDEDGIWRLKFF